VKPLLVVLHDSTRDEEVDAQRLADYLGTTFGIPTRLLGDFWIGHARDTAQLACELARLRVLDPVRYQLNPEPLAPETDFEKRRLADGSVRSAGILYDGAGLMRLYWTHLPQAERDERTCHIVLTRELFGTWDSSDLRWHARPIVLGSPSLVSMTGIVEGPARPPEFYIALRAGADPARLKKEMSEKMVHYDDSRMIEILKGYCAQALHHFITGEAFCDDAGCRLHNAHWQKEMIYAQIESPYEFCELHQRRLKRLRNAASVEAS
jgi:hypothetical protein